MSKKLIANVELLLLSKKGNTRIVGYNGRKATIPGAYLDSAAFALQMVRWDRTTDNNVKG